MHLHFLGLSCSLDIEMEAAANDVRDRVARVIGALPPDANPPVVTKADADAAPERAEVQDALEDVHRLRVSGLRLRPRGQPDGLSVVEPEFRAAPRAPASPEVEIAVVCEAKLFNVVDDES